MPHLSAEEHAARGKAERTEIPRAAHATWEALPYRPDPIALLEEQAKTRVPELVPIRHGRMLVSPFTFYGGAACVMASDLAATARSGLRVQLNGDAHLSNFGVFGSPERRMVFDINDFDETLPGPWDWDVKRLAASIELAGHRAGRHAQARNSPPWGWPSRPVYSSLGRSPASSFSIRYSGERVATPPSWPPYPFPVRRDSRNPSAVSQ